ncbi:hypothetical protein Tco_0542911 [Tanacetum coccineum]
MLSRLITNAEKSIEVSMSSSNEVRGSGVRGCSGFLYQSVLEMASSSSYLPDDLRCEREVPLEELVDLDSLDLGSLDDSASLLNFLLFIPRDLQWQELKRWLEHIGQLASFLTYLFSKLVTLSLNMNTGAKSGSAGNEVVASEAISVGVGVACCGRGLKK